MGRGTLCLLAIGLFAPGLVGALPEACEGAGSCANMEFSRKYVKLPKNYPANVTLGPAQGPRKTLDDLQMEGYDYAEYMHRSGSNFKSTALGAKFRNFKRKQLNMYWDDGTDPGVYSGIVQAMGRTATTTYIGHAFKFVDPSTNQLVARFEMEEGRHLYIVEPDEDDHKTRASKAYREAKEEESFLENYYHTHGMPWLSMHNREEPILNIWPTERLGQVHTVTTKQGYWVDDHTQSLDPVKLNLTVVSKPPEGPRVLVIENLMSEFEADHIVELGKQVVRPSVVGHDGGFASKTRTSENGWLRRNRTPILDTIHSRFADALGIDDSLINTKHNAEELQIVRYESGQQYQPHHDFSDQGVPSQRFLTLLLYIHPAEKGGSTSFPKANNGRGLKVKPPKGSAVLFYSMLPDGNGDDLSLHSGDPPIEGTKWVCNLWVWDPHR